MTENKLNNIHFEMLLKFSGVHTHFEESSTEEPEDEEDDTE